MTRQRKLSSERKAFIDNLIEHYHPEDAADVQKMLKSLLRDICITGFVKCEVKKSRGRNSSLE